MFNDIKVGDKVVVESGFSNKHVLKKVDRVTKTQVIVGSTKFRKDNGREISNHSSWYRDYIHYPTEEMMKNIEEYETELHRKSLINTLKATNWTKFSSADLIEISRLIGIIESK